MFRRKVSAVITKGTQESAERALRRLFLVLSLLIVPVFVQILLFPDPVHPAYLIWSWSCVLGVTLATSAPSVVHRNMINAELHVMRCKAPDYLGRVDRG